MTSGDVMTLSVRELKYKEPKGIEIMRYNSLIDDCARYRVTDIRKIKNKVVNKNARYEVIGLVYRNGKEKEVHRGIIRDRYLARSIKRLRSIRIPTGETMFLKVREMRPGEPERVGLMMYGSLIRDYAKFGIMNTRDL